MCVCVCVCVCEGVGVGGRLGGCAVGWVGGWVGGWVVRQVGAWTYMYECVCVELYHSHFTVVLVCVL